jgi:hypothetical protein
MPPLESRLSSAIRNMRVFWSISASTLRSSIFPVVKPSELDLGLATATGAARECAAHRLKSRITGRIVLSNT